MDVGSDTCLASYITSVLPNLTENVYELLLDALKDLGVENWEDFKYVQETDLSVLKPIEARKLIAHFRVTSKYAITE